MGIKGEHGASKRRGDVERGPRCRIDTPITSIPRSIVGQLEVKEEERRV
jgi:hypothetical protein